MPNQNQAKYVPAGTGPLYRGPGDKVTFLIEVYWPAGLEHPQPRAQEIDLTNPEEALRCHWPMRQRVA